MTKSPVSVAAQQRMTPDDYAVTAIASEFAERGCQRRLNFDPSVPAEF